MDQLTIKHVVKIFIKNLSLLITESTLYPQQHPNVIAQINQTMAALEAVFGLFDEVSIDIREEQFVFEGIPFYELKRIVGKTTQLLESKDIRCIGFRKGVSPANLSTFCNLIVDKARPLDVVAISKELGKAGITQITVEKNRELTADDGKGNFLPADKIYGSSIEANKLIYNTLQSEDTIPMDVVDKVAEDITNIIARDSSASLALASLRSYDEYTFTHSANVAILSVALAANIINDTALLNRLARAALLHDIGKIRIPTEVLNKPGKLNADDWVVLKSHPMLGVKILEQQEQVDKLAVLITCQHHMKYDLSGYPQIKTEDGVHPLSLIVNLCDVYDAITSKRAYKKAFPPDKALSIMMRLIGCDFEPQLFKIFTQMMGIYPPGSFVRLNTMEFALTKKVQPHALLLPEVKIIMDATGAMMENPEILDLSDKEQNTSGRSIEEVVDPTEMGIDIMPYL